VTILRYLALTVPSVIMMVCLVTGCSASPGAALSFALLAYAVAFAVYRARLEKQLGPPTHWTDRIGAVAVPMFCAGTGASAAVMAACKPDAGRWLPSCAAPAPVTTKQVGEELIGNRQER
jgi:hypothetical protein